jgi:hypothetical protein
MIFGRGFVWLMIAVGAVGTGNSHQIEDAQDQRGDACEKARLRAATGKWCISTYPHAVGRSV